MPFFGRNEVAVAYAAIYGASAAIVSLGMLQFLSGRDVSLRQVWLWPRQRGVMMGWPVSLLCGVALGAVLGGVAFVYLAVVQMFPHAAEMMQRSHARIAATPHLHAALIVMSVLIAPVAEEFLFRGLLYRALDREWGGWRAVLGSAVFFAAYHPALSWLPVGLLGATNAVLFKRTGRLAPTVVLHMTYNAIVMALG
jgi:membrane protease YdiL (CAAX protease family)